MIIKDDLERLNYLENCIKQGKQAPSDLYETDFHRNQKMTKSKVKQILKYIDQNQDHLRIKYARLGCRLYLDDFSYQEIADILNCLGFKTNFKTKFNEKNLNRSLFYRFYCLVLEAKKPKKTPK